MNLEDCRIATTLSSMIDDDQLDRNLKAATALDGLDMDAAELMGELRRIFDDLPVTQWETLETVWYWKEMNKNGWNQPTDIC